MILDLIRSLEDLRLTPYACPAGFWTIGYGHLCSENHPPILEAEAESFLEKDFESAQRQTLGVCPTLTGARLAAISDFTFNLGISRLRSSRLHLRINEGDSDGVVTELARWVHGGGRVLPGLVLRRGIESRIWQTQSLGPVNR